MDSIGRSIVGEDDCGSIPHDGRKTYKEKGQGMKHNELPSLSAIDRRDKMILWLATEVLETGVWDYEKFYELLEAHFALVSTWRELKK